MSKIQVLKSTHQTGPKKDGSGAYSFYRLACVYYNDKGEAESVGEIIHNDDVPVGTYPVSFSVASFQGKLSAKVIPLLPTIPPIAKS